MRFLPYFGILFLIQPLLANEPVFTRKYILKHNDAQLVIQGINFSVPNVSKRRVISGQGRNLVVTDIASSQNDIAELLPVLDQPSKETDPRRAQMEMVVRATNFLNQRRRAVQGKTTTAGVATYGGTGPFKAGQAYKSVYSDEDEKLMTKPRVLREDPVLPSTQNLILKGIFFDKKNARVALLNFGETAFTARDGGLYHGNRTRMKGIKTEVYKDHVVVTGLDNIPRKVTFRSSL